MSARTMLIAVGAIVVILAGVLLFPVTLPHVQLPAEPIGHVGGFTITNTRTLKNVQTGAVRTDPTRTVKYNPSPIVICGG